MITDKQFIINRYLGCYLIQKAFNEKSHCKKKIQSNVIRSVENTINSLMQMKWSWNSDHSFEECIFLFISLQHAQRIRKSSIPKKANKWRFYRNGMISSFLIVMVCNHWVGATTLWFSVDVWFLCNSANFKAILLLRFC